MLTSYLQLAGFKKKKNSSHLSGGWRSARRGRPCQSLWCSNADLARAALPFDEQAKERSPEGGAVLGIKQGPGVICRLPDRC